MVTCSPTTANKVKDDTLSLEFQTAGDLQKPQNIYIYIDIELQTVKGIRYTLWSI